ncbi:MAG: alpha/beta hydrolase [Actinobacteria bacterium]|jgi:arylformamidase|nr:alpha/beta hydrolase [Actinomycetota bacterium]
MSLETEYSPSSVAHHSVPWYIEQYGARSSATRNALGEVLRKVAYGTHVDEYLLLAQHSPEAPLLVFIHGGYWKALSADECSMWASDALTQGISFASINYTLAPYATLAHIVHQCQSALLWLEQHSQLTPQNTVVSGSSAGAHLAAMCSTAHPSNHFITGAVLLSGVYDLQPLLHTTVNDPLQLTKDAAISLSPQLQAVSPLAEVVVAWGEHETNSFKDQSRNYAQHLATGGCNVAQIEVEGCDHFDVIYDLITPATPLGDATLQLLLR